LGDGGIEVVRNLATALLDAKLVIAASGTVTLETALSGTPMVVVYKTSALTYFLARLLVRIPRIAMPNVLASETIVPELIQGEAVPERIAEEVVRMLGSPEMYGKISERLISIRHDLTREGGIAELARKALSLAERSGSG
jgi:lipid-A-disaccharide synthase